MRVLRLLPFVLLMRLPVFAQVATSTQRDPQAIKVTETAISALGGAAAISQSQSWTFQAQLDGPILTGNMNDNISVSAGPGSPVVMPDGKTITKPPRAFSSFFLPALLGAVLLKESKDPNYSMQYGGQTTIGAQAVSVVVFSLSRTAFSIAQKWYLANTTGLPSAVEFQLPAQIGRSKSLPGITILSDYRSVSGVLYPFRIVTVAPGRSLPETITLLAVNPNATASMVPVTTPTGGVQ